MPRPWALGFRRQRWAAAEAAAEAGLGCHGGYEARACSTPSLHANTRPSMSHLTNSPPCPFPSCALSRSMMAGEKEARRLSRDAPSFHWDYRWMDFPGRGRVVQHPHCAAVQTYRGHTVLSTLIRRARAGSQLAVSC